MWVTRGHVRPHLAPRLDGALPGERLAGRRHESTLSVITKRRILYWLAAMVAVLVVGTIIGLIWADTSNVAGSIAVATNIVGAVGIVVLLIALAVVTRRQRRAA
jgi:membrane protein YdbS with pleckstrin-like domain